MTRDAAVVTSIRIAEANLMDSGHAGAIVALVDAYARDPMGGGRGLPEDVKSALVSGLLACPNSLVFLAFDEERPVGVAICFRGFSTFRAAPLINIHDLAVAQDARGRGVGRRLIEAVAERGRALGCCKLTLEVRQDNSVAKGLYESVGFRGGEPAAQYLFWTMELGA